MKRTSQEFLRSLLAQAGFVHLCKEGDLSGNFAIKKISLIETSEDLQPLIDRMVIFPLDKAIPEDQRDPNIVEKLIVGRNYILSEALKALHDLVENGFRFTEIIPTESCFSSKNFASGIEAFVEECCILDENGRESTSVLYGGYIRYCEAHPEYKPKSINQFSSYLDSKYSLTPFNDGKVRGKIGIRFCELLRTDAVI